MFVKSGISIDIRDNIIILTNYSLKKREINIMDSILLENMEELFKEIKTFTENNKKQYISLIYNDINSVNTIVNFKNISKRYKKKLIIEKLNNLESKNMLIDYEDITDNQIIISSISKNTTYYYKENFKREDLKINRINNRVNAIIYFLKNNIYSDILVIDINNIYIDLILYKIEDIKIERLVREKDDLRKLYLYIDNIIENDIDIEIITEDLSILKELKLEFDLDKNNKINILSPSIGNIMVKI